MKGEGMDKVRGAMSTEYLTVVFRGVSPGQEAKELITHTKMVAASWSHAIHDRDAAREALSVQPAEPELAPEHVPATKEHMRAIDVALGLTELPPIRVSTALAANLEARAAVKGVVLQAYIRDLLAGAQPAPSVPAGNGLEVQRLQRVWEDTRTQRDELLAHIAGNAPLPQWAADWFRAGNIDHPAPSVPAVPEGGEFSDPTRRAFADKIIELACAWSDANELEPQCVAEHALWAAAYEYPAAAPHPAAKGGAE